MAIPEPIEFARRAPKPLGDPRRSCAHAERFEADAGAVLEQLLGLIEKVPVDQRDAVINQAKVHVYDLYRRDRLKATPNHTNSQGRRTHACLPDALDRVGDRIEAVERRSLEKRLDVRKKAPPAAPNDEQGSPLAQLLGAFGKS